MACGNSCGKMCVRGIYCKFVTVCPLVCCGIRENLKKDGVIVVDVNMGGKEMPKEAQKRFLDAGYRLSSDESHLILNLEKAVIELEIFKERAKKGCPYQ